MNTRSAAELQKNDTARVEDGAHRLCRPMPPVGTSPDRLRSPAQHVSAGLNRLGTRLQRVLGRMQPVGKRL